MFLALSVVKCLVLLIESKIKKAKSCTLPLLLSSSTFRKSSLINWTADQTK